MSYPILFRQIALSAAVAASGAAHAQRGGAVIIPMAIPSRVEPHIPTPVEEFALRDSLKSNRAHLVACFRELEIGEKPKGDMSTNEASAMIDCVDQKSIRDYVADPHHQADSVVQMLHVKVGGYSTTADLIGNRSDFSQKVADACGVNQDINVKQFIACADKLRDDRDDLALKWAFAVFGLGTTAVVGRVLLSAKREMSPATNSARDISPC